MLEDSKETPRPIEEQRREAVKGIPGMSPEAAQKILEGYGYKKDSWVIFTEQGLGSHYLRAIANIATGDKPRVLDNVYQEMFPNEVHGPIRKENKKTAFVEKKQNLNTKLGK